MKLLVLGLDWKGAIYANPQNILRKLVRDRIDSSKNEVLFWVLAPRKGKTVLTPGVHAVSRRGRFPHLRPLYDLLAPGMLVEDVKKEGFEPDAVIIHDFPLLPAARAIKRACGAKIVLYLSNLPTDLAKTRRAGSFKAAYHHHFEKMAKEIDAVAAINDTTRAYALSLGIPAEKIHVFNPDTIGPDEAYITGAKKGTLHEKYKIPADRKILLSVGRLEAEKAFDELIQAFAELRREDLVLVIAGEGSLHAALDQQIEKLGLKDSVILAGNVAREEIWNYYADADVFILLSHSEALGLVVWEAMYMNVPVIVSGAGGLSESVGKDGERGYLWKPKDGIAALAAKLTTCLDRTTITTMLVHARAYVEQQQKSIDIFDILQP